MIFSDFLNKLHSNSRKPAKELYLVQLISALCGEEEPFGKNKVFDSNSGKESKFSPALPDGLIGADPTYRKNFFKKILRDKKDESKGYKGLSAPIKNHILSYKNKDTFLAYLENSVAANSFSGLCNAFGISGIVDNATDRPLVFESIYEQFLEFARSENDAEPIVPQIVKQLLEDRESTQKSEFKDDIEEKHSKPQSQSDLSVADKLSEIMNVAVVLQDNVDKDARIKRHETLLDEAYMDNALHRTESVHSKFHSPNGVKSALKKDKEYAKKMSDIEEAGVQVNKTVKSLSELGSAMMSFNKDKIEECHKSFSSEDIIAFLEDELSKTKITPESLALIEAIKLMFKGNDYMAKGDIDEALSFFHEAAEKSGILAFSIYPMLGTASAQSGDIKTAIEYCNKALAIVQNEPTLDEIQTAQIYQQMGFCYFINNDCDKALENYNTSLELSRGKLGENHPYIATIYQAIGLTHYSVDDDNEKALECLNKTFEIFREQLGEDNPQTQQTREIIAKVEQGMPL